MKKTGSDLRRITFGNISASKFLLAAVFIFMAIPGMGQYALKSPLPQGIPMFQEELPSLRSRVDASLQSELEQIISKHSEWKTLASNQKMAIGLVDLGNPGDIRFARINGDKMMYAASLPKIAVLLAAMDAAEKGKLKETREVIADCHLMIRKSNNEASTRMIDRVGFEQIECVLTNPDLGLYDESCGGGLWCGKRYGKGGPRHGDPMFGISHGATVSQVCRFYYKLAFGKLISEERSRKMLEFLVDPGIHHKFVNTLERKAPKAKFFRKSGSWKNFHADSIMVWGPKRRYILVALLEDPSGEQVLRDLAASVDGLVNIGLGSR